MVEVKFVHGRHTMSMEWNDDTSRHWYSWILEFELNKFLIPINLYV